MGSKARIAKDILPLILKNRKEGQWYVEPFAGGMNSICEVSGNRLANDCNFYLIEMWKALVDGWVPSVISKEMYAHVRTYKEQYEPHVVGWVGFSCSYGGKWFGGYANDNHSNPSAVRYYQKEAWRNISKQIPKMQGVKFVNHNYLQMGMTNKIVYCDPPYRNTTGYGNSFNHDEFWTWVRKMSIDNEVFVSEYEAPDDFECLWSKTLSSTLSTKGNKPSVEKLFKLKQ